jgi:hypothetical protein
LKRIIKITECLSQTAWLLVEIRSLDFRSSAGVLKSLHSDGGSSGAMNVYGARVCRSFSQVSTSSFLTRSFTVTYKFLGFCGGDFIHSMSYTIGWAAYMPSQFGRSSPRVPIEVATFSNRAPSITHLSVPDVDSLNALPSYLFSSIE